MKKKLTDKILKKSSDKSYFFLIFATVFIFFIRTILKVDGFWEDLIYQEFPHRLFAKNSILNFTFPHWNPYTFNGMPFFAAIHTGVLYPFNLLISLMPVSNSSFWYFMEIMTISHFAIAGCVMFIYLRYRNASQLASLFGSISFMLTGFFLTHIIHSLIIYTIAWLPLIILFLEKSIKNNRLQDFIITGLILGITIFAGHPQITFYEFIFLSIYSFYLWLNLENKNSRTFLMLSIPFVIAICIAMIQLLPTVNLSQFSNRVAWTFNEACVGSMSISQFLTLLMPKLFGAYTGDPAIPSFWLQTGINNGAWTYWDTTFYMGIAILIFAIVQLTIIKKDHFNLFVLIWSIFAISIALGQHLFIYKLFFNFVPGFGKFRAPARILFTLSFLFPVLAAKTFDSLLEGKLQSKKMFFFIAFGILAFLGFLTGTGFLKDFWPIAYENRQNLEFSIKQGWILFANIIFLAIPVILFLNKKISQNFAGKLIIGALLIDIFTFGFGIHQNRGSSGAKFFNQNRPLAQAIKAEQKNERFRTNSRQFILSDTLIMRQGMMQLRRNQGMIDKIELVEGYNPLQLAHRLPPINGRNFQELIDLLNIKYLISPSYNRQGNPISLNQSRLPRAKMFYNYKEFKSDSSVHNFMSNNSFEYKKTLLISDKISLSPTLDSVNNRVIINKYENNKITLKVNTEKSGILWLSEIWYPAWKVYVDGKKERLLRADYSFRAVEIPKGDHTVIFKYDSIYFNIGAIITILTLIGSIGYLGYYYFNFHKKD